MPDLPALLDRLREQPDDASRWLALSRWLADNGRDDEAVAVRVFWPTFRDSVSDGVSLEAALADLARHAQILGDVAREIEERRLRGPDE
jgi:hypothetical protein